MSKVTFKTGAGYTANRVDPATCSAITQFLGHEAKLLDSGKFEEWLSLLDANIAYDIPVRIAVNRNSPDEFPVGAYRLSDDLAMISKRVERTSTGEDWSEAPPSRTMRNVGSIEVELTDENDLYIVHSTMLVYRERAVEDSWDLIPTRRIDHIRLQNGICTLVKRRIILTETIVKTPNLGIFL